MSLVPSENEDRLQGCEQRLEAYISEVTRKPNSRTEPTAEEAGLPLVEDLKICETLRRIVSGLSADATLQEDMLQECLLCLWQAESKSPGQTVSWYLQHCRFHVQHWLFLGRSVDSPKRAGSAHQTPIGWDDADRTLEEYHTNGELLDTVCVRDLIVTLARHLNPKERAVLGGLAEGCVLREAAFKSGLSYPTALKYRRRIAALTIKLGVCAPREGHEVKVPPKSANPEGSAARTFR